MTTVTVSGLRELDAKLKQLGQVAGAKAMRAALFAASKPILDQARANVPKRSGALGVSMSRMYSVKNNATASLQFNSSATAGSKFTVSVGPKPKNRTAVGLYNLSYKRKRPVRGIFYGHLIEFAHLTKPKNAGTGNRIYINKRGQIRIVKKTRYDTTGQRTVPGKPFLVPALQSRASEATQLLADKLRREIDKRLAK